MIGYGRVSTEDQHLDAQIDALKAAGCERVFTDKLSGKLAQRPELDAALDYLRHGDVLVITKLDRLGRSLRNLIELVLMLEARGVDLRVLDQDINTKGPSGKLMFHVIGAMAEFERDMISERTRDGLAAARARGRKGGRRPKLNAAKVETARKLYAEKRMTVAEIADVVGCARSTLYRALNEDAA